MRSSSQTLRLISRAGRTTTLILAAALATATGCAGKGDIASDTGTIDANDLELFAEFVGLGSGMESDDENIYLTDERILSISKSDATITELFTPDTYGFGWLADDEDNIYWVVSATDLSFDTIMYMPKDGGTPRTLVSGLMSPTGTVPYAYDMVSDGTTLYVIGLSTGPNTVTAVPLDGSAPMNFGAPIEDAFFVSVDEDYVYVAAGLNRCTIYRVPKTGGEFEELGSQPEIHLALTLDSNSRGPEMEIDDGTIYWANRYHNSHGLGAITAMPVDGGPVKELAIEQNSPKDMVVHDGDMFWVNSGDNWDQNGQLMQLQAGATEPEVLVENLRSPTYVQVDDDYIYVTATDPEADIFDLDVGHLYRIER